MFWIGLVAGLVLGAVLGWILVSWSYRAALDRAGLLDYRGRLIVELDDRGRERVFDE